MKLRDRSVFISGGGEDSIFSAAQIMITPLKFFARNHNPPQKKSKSIITPLTPLFHEYLVTSSNGSICPLMDNKQCNSFRLEELQYIECYISLIQAQSAKNFIICTRNKSPFYDFVVFLSYVDFFFNLKFLRPPPKTISKS